MKKILLIIGVATLFAACQKDFSVWKEYNEAELKVYEANLGSNSSGIVEHWISPSGLLVEVYHRGQTGIVPKLASYVYCEGWGKLVDDTRVQLLDPMRGFLVGSSSTIKGLQEILCQMPKGSWFRIYVPYEIGYGKDGDKATNFHIPPYSTLIFEIEIVDVFQNTPE